MKNLIKIKRRLFKFIYPNGMKCIFCFAELNQNSYNITCESCLKSLPFITNCCSRCGNPMSDDLDRICYACKTGNYHFIKAFSVFEYKDEVLTTIHRFKYHDGKYLYKPLARFMIEYYATQNINVDCVTYVPMIKKKEKQRRYNQAKLLAEEFSTKMKLPLVCFCDKIVDNSTQTELDFRSRHNNVKDTFKFNSKFRKVVKNKRVLLIDDIFTTGATSNEICKVLLEHGASECYVFTLAHTALKNQDLNSKVEEFGLNSNCVDV